MEFVFQDYKLIPDRTIYENIELPLRLIGLTRKEARNKVERVFDDVGLKNGLNLFPNQFHSGHPRFSFLFLTQI